MKAHHIIEMAMRKARKVKYHAIDSTDVGGRGNYGTSEYDTVHADQVLKLLKKIDWSRGPAAELLAYAARVAKGWRDNPRKPDDDDMVTPKLRREFSQLTMNLEGSHILGLALHPAMVYKIGRGGALHPNQCFGHARDEAKSSGSDVVVGLLVDQNSLPYKFKKSLVPLIGGDRYPEDPDWVVHAWNQKDGKMYDVTRSGGYAYYPGRIIPAAEAVGMTEMGIAQAAWQFSTACEMAVDTYRRTPEFQAILRKAME